MRERICLYLGKQQNFLSNKEVFMSLDKALISVFLSSFAPNALRARASGTLRER
ncbi:hypothetical protein [Nodularia spumigena]|uniref:hypothetical protein n=1 Tax=Nodularia spumigena TaxID=70799 RepID=UPI00232C1592|nr:hypothetical protein [Nodularia spumigena]MDB9324395.1 hypothetical protein [Nodularia spumigena CS-591/07A]MDB9501216.1 hypothetical protein [Nodularia spumigena CS-336/02]